MSEAAEKLEHPTPPWLFMVLVLPFGAAVGFLQNAVPYWLRTSGITVAHIAEISTLGFMPYAFKIFWVPLIDIVPYRKAWYVFGSVSVGGCLAAAAMLPDPAHNLFALTILMVALGVAATVMSGALNALMAVTTRPEDKGRAGGFYMAGNLGGTGVISALAIWLAEHTSPRTCGLLLGLVCVVSTFFCVMLTERRGDESSAAQRQHASVWRRLGDRLWAIVKDVASIALTREGLTGLLICAAPVGCGALSNLFTAFAPDYHVSSTMVEFVSSLGGGIVGALGSLVGGFLADRINRRFLYVLSGALTATCALVMSTGPLNPTTYIVGSLIYLTINGISFAAFAGLVLEMVSKGKAVGTKYALFVATSNLAINYTTYLDGRASNWQRLSGVGSVASIKFDGIITFAAVAFFAALALFARQLLRGPDAAPPAAPAL